MKNILYTIILFLFFSFNVFARDGGVNFFDIEKHSAEQGNPEGQFNLGSMYDDGRGVTQDYQEAAKWYLRAAEQGHANAQLHLGLMYKEGEGVTQDYKQAAKWFRLAAEQGNNLGQFNHALMYYEGRGVIKDMIIAHIWFNIAASSGNNNAKTGRDIVEELMTSEQIVKAQELARECIKKNYKDCG